jgi:DEAD/DEAH box helicase domain-containing protein
MSIIVIRCRMHNRGEHPRPFQIMQIGLDANGKKTRRDLTASNDDVVKEPWEYVALPIEPGLYCVHCINEGKREPMPIDKEDLRDLGLADEPLVFQPPHMFDSQALVRSLQAKFGDQIRDVHELPAQPAVYTDRAVLNRLHPGLQRALHERLLPKAGNLYAFQASALQAAFDGHDVIVTTPTASGKSLTYILPIVDTLLRDPKATALYISPLVALTEDQLEAVSRIDGTGTDWIKKGERFSIHRVCRTLDTGAGKLTVARYDGQVTKGDRQEIRQRKPQYVLTTPDMLHAAILAGAFDDRQWHHLLGGLRYVVIDELHTYRGVLGASFANLLRRLQRLCRMHGANPQFLCASATIVDPEQTVEQLIGRRPVVVDGSGTGAPQHARKVVLWSAGVGDGTAYALSTQAKNVLLHLLSERVRGIAFARSISEINDIYRFVSAELREMDICQPIISPFMRELLPEKKRSIIRDLKQGRLHGVISTTALSMGIDIGSLSAAVIIGFPGSIAQFWQQAGRAGRAGEGAIVLIADRNPLDQFFVQHPDVLFDLRAEPVYCNPNNPYIVRGHLLLAAQEAPLNQADILLFGMGALEQSQHLKANGLLELNGLGQLTPTAAALEQARTPFRNLTFAVSVMTQDRKPIVETDAARAQRALHKHAHYQHIDRYYEVVEYDLDWDRGRGEIIVRELEHPEYTTTARVAHEVSVVERQLSDELLNYEANYGIVQCRTTIGGYYKVPLFARNDPFQFQPLGRAAPEPLEYQTQAFWLTFAPALLQPYVPAEQDAGLYSLAGAVRLATAIEELCDPSDIEALGFTVHPDTGLPMIMLYDSVPGGVGIAEAAFSRLDRVRQRAEQILADCPYCSTHPESRGCPYCVTAQYGDETTINRHVALDLIRALRVTTR